jgi:DNA-binding beta-propeller fold protein YncE
MSPSSRIILAAAFAASLTLPAAAAEQHLLYVASPGTRNYVEYGGVGILVFDIDNGYKFVRRIPTWDVPKGKDPENIKGIAASAKTGRVYVSSLNRIIAVDAVSGKRIWDKTYEGGCDRLAIAPDGKTLYVPQLEGPNWHVVNAANGAVIATVETKSGSHNTIYAADGAHVYLAGLHSPVLSVADPKTNTVASTVGPFATYSQSPRRGKASCLCAGPQPRSLTGRCSRRIVRTARSASSTSV